MHRRSFLTIAIGATVVVPAAPPHSQAGQSFTVRDSAGVRIVESLRPQLDAGRNWRIEPTPVLVIGADAREAAYQFSSIDRVVRFSSGLLAIANSPLSELRIYDARGRFMRRVGRRGGGPGEFYRDFDGVDMCSRDTLVVQMRIGIMRATADTVLDRIDVRTPEGMRPAGKYACGRGKMMWGFSDTLAATRPNGFSVGRSLWRISTTGGRWIGGAVALETGESYRLVLNERTPAFMATAPFARVFAAALSSAGNYVLNSRAAEVARYNDFGAITMSIRIRQPRRAVTPAIKKQVLDTMMVLGRSKGYDMTLFPRMFAEPGVATSLPAFADMKVDDDENVWVREYDDTDMITIHIYPAGRPRRWAVFAPDGHLITYVSTPARFTPHQIGRDFVLGVWLDSDDVPQAHMYRLAK